MSGGSRHIGSVSGLRFRYGWPAGLQASGKGVMALRVLMFGWEFPPFKTGGLGTACYGLTRGLKHAGVDVTFVVPKSIDKGASEHVKVVGTGDAHTSPSEKESYAHVKALKVNVVLSPYERPEWRFEEQEAEQEDQEEVAGAFCPGER